MSYDTNTIAKKIKKRPAETWLQDEYIVFAKYAVKDRALVGADGLKPVNRRILWTMYTNNWTHNHAFVKAVKVSGAVIGAFHPHGDAAVSDAMAKMAQTFNLRVPLVENFGSVGGWTGDTAAAPRYWEARMSKEAYELIRECKEGAVEIGRNFSGSEPEAHLLPIRWPVTVINGTEGIAVGYASKIPSHNPTEVMDAAVALLDNEDLTVDELLEIMPGPDLPTGAEILEVDGIREYYETGKGRFAMRAVYDIEKLPRGRTRIIFRELPYKISAPSIKERITKLIAPREVTKSVGGRKRKVVTVESPYLKKSISSVMELTDNKNGLRLVIETTQGTDYHRVLAELFKLTNLQSYFSVNATVLSNGSPVRVGVIDMLRDFIDLRRECVVNKNNFALNKIGARLEQLDAFLAVLVNIDEAIRIICSSDSQAIAREGLVDTFEISEKQADYILSMQLRRLTRADAVAIREEKDELVERAEEIRRVLDTPELIDAQVRRELIETQKVIASDRRSVIVNTTANELKKHQKEVLKNSKAKANTVFTVTRFADGTLLKTEGAFKYALTDMSLKYSPIVEQLEFNSTDSIVIVTSNGEGHRMPLSHILENTISDATMLGVSDGGRVVGVGRDTQNKTDVGLFIACKDGGGKITNADYPVSKDTFPVITLNDGDSVVNCFWVDKDTYTNSSAVFITESGKILLTPLSGFNAIGSKGKPIKGVKLVGDDSVVYANVVDPSRDISVVTASDIGIKHILLSDVSAKGRGSQGMAVQNMRANENRIVNAYVGENPVMCADNTSRSIVNPPAISKRTNGSINFNAPLLIGSRFLTSKTEGHENDTQ